ncbi:unnamed protein product [Sphenostylis stenocarpa]|uniref:Uncharacterized protein n=1 Tax=Sphenostylis stenocarpa TaxID=92480 RepID=A0AA86SKB0_9FABA|nr:unnamed protein product [Sphenostylis stenocarpa]
MAPSLALTFSSVSFHSRPFGKDARSTVRLEAKDSRTLFLFSVTSDSSRALAKLQNNPPHHPSFLRHRRRHASNPSRLHRQTLQPVESSFTKHGFVFGYLMHEFWCAGFVW